MTTVDLVAILFVGVTALVGFRKGLVASALSAAGIVAGAVVGARLAPHLLHGSTHSPYTPLAALAGAGFGAIVLEAVGSLLGGMVRGTLVLPPLRFVDSAGGLAFGVVTGLALVWILGAAALILPGQTQLRRGAQRSYIVRRLNELVPPAGLLNALARIDPFPAISGPAAPALPPDPQLLAAPGVERSASRVVRVLGTACGLAISGSGWVVRPGLVVTAAHVVAGEDNTTVELARSSGGLAATPVVFDAHNDIAILRVPALQSTPGLPLGAVRSGAPVAILGFPEDGPFTATPARIGTSAVVLSQDAYGNGPVTRTITSLRGLVRHGDSGGPVVDARGAVEATVFAARVGARAGYGIPSEIVLRDLARARAAVSSGACTAG